MQRGVQDTSHMHLCASREPHCPLCWFLGLKPENRKVASSHCPKAAGRRGVLPGALRLLRGGGHLVYMLKALGCPRPPSNHCLEPGGDPRKGVAPAGG